MNAKGTKIKMSKTLISSNKEGETVMKEKRQVNWVKKTLSVIKYTQEEYEEVEASQLTEELSPRLSLGNAKKVLVSILRDHKLVISEPETIMDWTYKAVVVEGASGDEIAGKKDAEKTLSIEEFDALTGEEVAGFIKKYTTEKRAGEIIMALISGEYFKPTASQVIQLANGRIAVDGVSLPKTGSSKTAHVVVMKGIKINGNSAHV